MSLAQMQKTAEINEIFNDQWEIKKCIGKGSFSEIFVARDITRADNHLVAIKVQNQDFDSSVIRWEGDVLKALRNTSAVPKFYFYGCQDKRDFLVMELLGGEDMAMLRNRIRSNCQNGLIALPGASYLTQQMLKCIKCMHDKGFVHRDIKPANFVRRDRSSTEFLAIDFGIAKLYRDKNGALRPKKEKAEFRGTTLYASPYTHEGQDQAPRDDLISIMFVFLDLLGGKLPWTDATRAKDKPEVTALKRRYFDDLPLLVRWVSDLVSAAENKAANKSHGSDGSVSSATDSSDHSSNFPPTAQKEILKVFEYLKTLEYEDTPDYSLVQQGLVRCLGDELAAHKVDNPAYSYCGFNWLGGCDRSNYEPGSSSSGKGELGDSARKMSRSSSGNGVDIKKTLTVPPLSFAAGAPVKPAVEYYTGNTSSSSGIGGVNLDALQVHRLNQVCVKMNQLLKDCDLRHELYATVSNTNGNSIGTSSSGDGSTSSCTSVMSVTEAGTSPSRLVDISVGVRWKNLTRDLMLLPEQGVTLQALRLFHLGLTAHDGFLNIKDTDRSDVWSNFLEVQQVANQFYEMYGRISAANQTAANNSSNSGGSAPSVSGSSVGETFGLSLQGDEEEEDEEIPGVIATPAAQDTKRARLE